MRKPALAICEQQRCRPAHLRSLTSTFVVRGLDSTMPLLICCIRKFKMLASFWSWVGRPVCRFSRDEAHMNLNNSSQVLFSAVISFVRIWGGGGGNGGGVMAHQDYFTNFEPCQLLAGMKTGDSPEKLPGHQQTELGLSHVWPQLSSNTQRWDDKRFRVLKIRSLNHWATGAISKALMPLIFVKLNSTVWKP